MRRLTFLLAALFILSGVYADTLRLSDSVPCRFLGSLYYGDNVGYQLNFEVENNTLLGRRLVTVTIVVPRKGSKSNVLPEGEFTLGSCDSLFLNAIDYYESGVRYDGYTSDTLGKTVFHCSFQQCRVRISTRKGRVYDISVEYQLSNGEKGVYTYVGKLRTVRDDDRAKFNFMPEEKHIKNWQLTAAKIEVAGETAFSSREAQLKFLCADEIYGEVTIYLPLDSINGHYKMKCGKEAGCCEVSRGGYDEKGYFNLFRTGIEEDSSGYNYYPRSGYIDITDGKMFFEFITFDGSTVRGVFRGAIPVKGGSIN